MYKKYPDVITYNCHVLQRFVLFGWSNKFYHVLLKLTLQYSTLFKSLVNYIKIFLVKYSTISPIWRPGRIKFYSICSVSFSSVAWFLILISAITAVARFEKYVVSVLWNSSSTNWCSVIFCVTLKFQWRCTALIKYDFPVLSYAVHTTPSLPEISFSTIPSFRNALFLSSPLMINAHPTLTCCSLP